MILFNFYSQLVHYLDIVEVHLAYHVSRKSDMFFSTLTSQQELQDQIHQTRQQVSSLRQKLGSADQISTHELLKAVKLHVVQSRHIQIYHKVSVLSCIFYYISVGEFYVFFRLKFFFSAQAYSYGISNSADNTTAP